MKYKMEELIPVVGRLTEKYTAWESTSVTYEKAQQLMEAVIYCIREIHDENTRAVDTREKMTAQRAYETGLACVEKKVRDALAMYHDMLHCFDGYENRCLQDTFVKGMPEFFKWYDMKYAPQDTIIMLDYPVLRDIGALTGIDRIYEYMLCIRLEQEFLGAFPRSYVMDVLARYNSSHRDMIENICEVVYGAALGHVLIGKPLSDEALTAEDFAALGRMCRGMDAEKLQEKIRSATQMLVEEACGGREDLTEYLLCCARGITVRIANSEYTI